MGGVGPAGIGTYFTLISPNALREARAHFGCPQMAGVLLRGTDIPLPFLSKRHYRVRIRSCRQASTAAHV